MSRQLKEKIFKRKGALRFNLEKSHPAYETLKILLKNVSKEEAKKGYDIKLKLVERNRVIIFPNERLANLYSEYVKTNDPKFKLNCGYEKRPIFSTTQFGMNMDRITMYLPIIFKEIGKDNYLKDIIEWDSRGTRGVKIEEIIGEYEKNFS